MVPGELSARSTATFATLYEAYHRRAYRLAVGLCREPALAEEVVSEAFLRASSPWKEGRVTDFWPYLRRCVVNEVYGAYRRRRAEQRAEGRAAAAVADATTSHEQRTVDRATLVRALAGLSAGQRAVIVLRYYEDLSQEQTAAVLGVSPGPVKTQASRAMARLRPMLGHDAADGVLPRPTRRTTGRADGSVPGR